MDSSTNNKKRVAVIGAGLVGALNACYFARRGFVVDLYELREDIRKQGVVRGRSINLALSHRGRQALKQLGLEDAVISHGIPMYARMIHNRDGTKLPIPYGKPDQYIMSIDRRKLNELLISAAEKFSNVHIHFQHKLVSCKFAQGETCFKNADGLDVRAQHDLVVGCDGAYSKVRGEMTKSTRMNASQEFIPHGYMELRIPPTSDEKFSMEKNYLHIWPRNQFMLIGLPNTQDSSFVATLFMPFDIFCTLKTETDVLEFFKTTFPDALSLIGEEAVVNTFKEREALPMVSIKCSPYNVGKAVIMGDAAHAMVPFYGQGMNSGFEDCIIFDDILTENKCDIAKTLPEYSSTRNPDAEAICDLAMYNYVEMRQSVNSKLFRIRKKVDNFLHWLMPNTWIPLYTSVAFTRVPYGQCVKNKEWQDKVINRCLLMLGASVVIGTVVSAKILTTWGTAESATCYVASWMDKVQIKIGL